MADRKSRLAEIGAQILYLNSLKIPVFNIPRELLQGVILGSEMSATAYKSVKEVNKEIDDEIAKLQKEADKIVYLDLQY